MLPEPQQGTLIQWDDQRGFGFVQPHDSAKTVFLHISGLRPHARRPRVGDTVTFETKMEADGKLRAYGASLKGVAAPVPRPVRHAAGRRTTRTRIVPPPQWLKTLPGVFVVLAIAFWNYRFDNKQAPWGRNKSHAPVSSYRDPPGGDFSGFTGGESSQQDMPPPPSPQYTIKGNISLSTGIRYYHMPGCEDYAGTKIDTGRGERWFRTEQDAVAAGWRKAPR